MAGRRSLVDGMKTVDRRKELAFVKGVEITEPEEPKAPKRKPKPRPKEKREGEEPTPAALPAMPAPTSRMPLTTRIRTDFGTALKRASLERQLSGEKPNTVQDILEEALEPWLRDRGFLKD